MNGIRLRVLLVTERRRLDAEARILAALADKAWHYGLDLSRYTGLAGGHLAPAMDRLEAAGMVEARWGERSADARYRRRYYRLRAER